MKIYFRLIIPLIVILTILAVPTTASAGALSQTGGQTFSGDQLILGNNYVLSSGQTLNGSLVVLGGNATIAKDATVNGDIALLGGNLDLTGAVNGTVAALGANVSLGKGAAVSGEILSMGGNISGTENATIRGGIRTFTPRAFLFDRDTLRIPDFNGTTGTPTAGTTFLSFFTGILQILAMAVLAVIVALILPRPTKHVADQIANQPWLSGGAGLITFLATPLILIILTITIILIPITVLAVLALVVACIFGWIALGFVVGERMAVLFKTDWADAVSAGLGTLVLGIVTGLLNFVPCLGGLISFVFVCAALGSVILSGFGTRPFIPQKRTTAMAVEVIPPASPAPQTPTDAIPPSTPPSETL